MKRYLPLALIFSMMGAVYACSSDKTEEPANPGNDAGNNIDNNNNNNNQPDSSNNNPDTGGGDGGGGDTFVPPTGNPIEGIAAPTAVLTNDGTFYDGPTWHAKENALYFTIPLDTAPGLYRMAPTGGAATPVRTEAPNQGPIGSTVDKNGALVIAEGNKVVRMLPDGGGVTTILTEADAGGTGAAVLTPNDVVARLSDNTLYVTDPGYFAGDPPATNRLYRITPAGAASVAVDFGADVPRPNGIAISKDEKSLYVSFTQPPMGQIPNIMKYPINADGSLGNATKFVDVGAGTDPDGLAIDESGNVYCATKTGVAVFKADGSGKWGDIAIPAATQPVTGVTFGGADKKTLYITTQGKIYSVAVKIAGLPQ